MSKLAAALRSFYGYVFGKDADMFMEGQKKTLFQLFVPLCLETCFYMLSGMVDTLMLSSVGDQAVGAVGTANTYIGVFIIMFSVVSMGMLAVMTQNIGAGRPGIACQARNLGLLFNGVLGIAMSIFLFACSGMVLHVVGIASALRQPAEQYLRIVGAGSILNALIPIMAGYLRAFGYTKQPLFATMTGNILNFILNAVFLFQFQLGVQGVAAATVISKVVNLMLLVVLAQHLVPARKYPERGNSRDILCQIIRIGFPSALESIIYNVAMTLVIRFLNQMDADGINVAARSYTVQITNLSFCVGNALAQANAIMTGWYMGAGEYETCDRQTRKAAVIGTALAAGTEILFAMCAPLLLPVFTKDATMIALVQKLMFIDIALEIGRVTNLVYGNALKTSGDAVFPVIMGAVFMFLCAAGGTYLFGMRLHMAVVGAYIGLASDECCRAIGMILRWRSGAWKKKGLVRG